MTEQVQIDTILFLDICKLIKFKDELTEIEYKELNKSVCERIDNKLQRMINRMLYSKYKRALTKEEKDKALEEYLRERSVEE